VPWLATVVNGDTARIAPMSLWTETLRLCCILLSKPFPRCTGVDCLGCGGEASKEIGCEPGLPSSFFFVRPSQLRRIL
jgi:hypothetical protein